MRCEKRVERKPDGPAFSPCAARTEPITSGSGRRLECATALCPRRRPGRVDLGRYARDPSPIQNLALREKLAKLVKRQNCRADWRVGDYDDPIPLLLKIELPAALGSVGADILWAHKRWQREALEQAVGVEVEGDKIPVLHPEDLILMKLEAGGPQDFLDVQQLLSVAPPQLNVTRLKETAARLRLGKVLKKCLRDISGKK